MSRVTPCGLRKTRRLNEEANSKEEFNCEKAFEKESGMANGGLEQGRQKVLQPGGTGWGNSLIQRRL